MAHEAPLSGNTARRHQRLKLRFCTLMSEEKYIFHEKLANQNGIDYYIKWISTQMNRVLTKYFT